MFQISKLLLIIVLIVVSVDMYKHGGYEGRKLRPSAFLYVWEILDIVRCHDTKGVHDYLGSNTSQVLRQHGVEKALVDTYHSCKVYTNKLER